MSRLHAAWRQVTKFQGLLRILGSTSSGKKASRNGKSLQPLLDGIHLRPGFNKYKHSIGFSFYAHHPVATQKEPQNYRHLERSTQRVRPPQAALGLVEDARIPEGTLLVSLDTEKDLHGKITQIGLAILDPRQLQAPPDASSRLGSVHVHFFQIESSKIGTPHPTITPTEIPKGAIPAAIKNCLSLPYRGGREPITPNIVLLGHSIKSDLWSLRQNGADLEVTLPIRAVICTYDISKSLLAYSGSSLKKGHLTLAGALKQFGVSPLREELHNAASDALYALQLALLLGTKSIRTEHGVTKLRHAVQTRHLASVEATTHAIVRHGSPGADRNVGFHLMEGDIKSFFGLQPDSSGVARTTSDNKLAINKKIAASPKRRRWRRSISGARRKRHLAASYMDVDNSTSSGQDGGNAAGKLLPGSADTQIWYLQLLSILHLNNFM